MREGRSIKEYVSAYGDLIRDVVYDERLETAKRLIKNLDNLTLEDISFVVNLPLSTVEELASQIPKEA